MNYDELYQKAEGARIHDRHDEAIKLYDQALVIGGARDHAIHHMKAVTLGDDDKWQAALDEINPLINAASGVEKANLLRDQARFLAGLKRYDEAEAPLNQALELLSDQSSPEYAITISYRGRLELKRGDPQSAVADLQTADQKLKAGNNRYFELYNKLHLAGALIAAGKNDAARTALDEAERLIPQYGSGKHQQQVDELRAKLQ